MSTHAHGFGQGFLSPIRGLELIASNRRVRRLAIVPFALTFLVFIAGVFLGLPFIVHLIPFIAQNGVNAIGFATGSFGFIAMYWLVTVLAWPVAAFALLFVLFLISRLLATPFYSLLAERVLIERKLKPDDPFALSVWLRTLVPLMIVAIVKTVLFLIVGAMLFVLSFIPGLGAVTAFGFLLMAAFDVVDLSMEAMQMSLGERLKLFASEIPAFSGLAAAMGLVFLLPGLNFFLFPAAVAGGSEIIRRGSKGQGK